MGDQRTQTAQHHAQGVLVALPVGGALLLVYAIRVGAPVFLLGQSFGFVVHVRNRMLWKSEEPRAPAG